jgi:Rrf2 family nitric oxide-sensitive transcriptional repressor
MLAACAERSAEQVTTQQLAVAARTTKDHAARIVALLVRHGFLASWRGRHGGLILAETPEAIRIGAVLKATQSELAELRNRTEPADRSGNSIFDTIVQAAFANFLALMDRFTVADLVAQPPSRRVSCLDCGLMNPARLRPWPLPSRHHQPPRSGERPVASRAATTPTRAKEERNASHVLRLRS